MIWSWLNTELGTVQYRFRIQSNASRQWLEGIVSSNARGVTNKASCVWKKTPCWKQCSGRRGRCDILSTYASRARQQRRCNWSRPWMEPGLLLGTQVLILDTSKCLFKYNHCTILSNSINQTIGDQNLPYSSCMFIAFLLRLASIIEYLHKLALPWFEFTRCSLSSKFHLSINLFLVQARSSTSSPVSNS